MGQPQVLETPMRDTPRGLLVDVRCYELGRKLHRNVLMARNGVTPANFIVEQTLNLKGSTSSSGQSHTLQGSEGNTLTLVTCAAPVRMRVVRDAGVLDLGPQTLLALTSPILSLELQNEGAESVDVEIVHA